MTEFVNWSGSMRFRPARVAEPTSEAEVVDLVRRACDDGRTVRPVGSGHSSVPLMATDDDLVRLDRMSGLIDHDADGLRARLLPGTGLAEAGELLDEHGLALENLGDVDYQALAGAISTGTHGTGLRFGNLSQMLVGGRLVAGTGEVVAFGEDAEGAAAEGADVVDPDPELLRAAQLSLGSLGILTSLTLRVAPEHELHRINWCTHIDWVLAHYDELNEVNERFDVYWYPRSDEAQVRTLNPPGQEPDLVPPEGTVHEETTGPGHEIIPSVRELRFEEMEYMLPLDDGLATFEQVRDRVKQRHRADVAWRVLMRTVAADDVLISNCHRRPTMTIALLQNTELPHAEYFADLEPLLRDAGGRPHWGKKHTLHADELAGLYPEWGTFARVRARLDPDGVMQNDYLRDLLGDVTQEAS